MTLEAKARRILELSDNGVAEPFDILGHAAELARAYLRLREALAVAANQLEGVALAFRKHGDRLDPDWFIENYGEFANRARDALKEGE
jgi:hypothetical protein